MPKNREQKQATITALVEGLKSAKAVVFANFQGLTVAALEELRRACRKENVKVLVAKKTLVKRAFDEVGLTGTDPESFSGGVATLMGLGDEVAPAKVVVTFAKKNEAAVVYGGILEGKFIAVAEVKHLASLPSKQELLAKLVGSLNAPVSGFVNALAGNLRGLVNVLNNIQKAKV